MNPMSTNPHYAPSPLQDLSRSLLNRIPNPWVLSKISLLRDTISQPTPRTSDLRDVISEKLELAIDKMTKQRDALQQALDDHEEEGDLESMWCSLK